MFESLKPMPADPLLQIIAAHRADTRSDKIDLGVGVFRDEAGGTPILRAVKAAERYLVANQPTKGYLGIEGDPVFTDLLRPIIFGKNGGDASLVPGIQTPGGGGALRLGGELIATARPDAKLWLGTPSWPNHRPIFEAVKLEVREYRFADLTTQTLLFDEMMAALRQASAGDVVLLHGCCHNPTGLDLNHDQWREVADLCSANGLIPFVDLAYQGLGESLEADAMGLRTIFERVPELLLAYSCDKNFGLYRERTGALYVKASSADLARNVASNLAVHARVSWSMPPDHGAAVVRAILEQPELEADWQAEVAEMGQRIRAVRRAIASAAPSLSAIAHEYGLFSNLAVSREQVDALRTEHGIYIAPSGRMNVAGLKVEDAPRLVAALDAIGALPGA
ncbi:aromatic amino acid aminotransferase [Sphingomonas endophytica]|uniref:Aromatic amino acid aminotransferase n=1 Tax=Sphingomonas endophytica TaxID=869719 RepID=A0A147HZM3_9SPHN|nr:amino acid aminotransferase [Sphingomonas endophytica]KTT70429.1 aromatic amino acid aminotransferase [Sphingomonas endophytica]